MVNLPLQRVPIVDYGPLEPAMTRYREAGTARARELGNRGPIRFAETADPPARPALHPDITEAYWRLGFYVFEGVLGEAELKGLERDLAEMLSRAPAARDADVDAEGRPALGAGCQARNLSWVRPLSDPLGGTDYAHGRHPVRMAEPVPPPGAPEHVLQLILGSLQFSEAALRLYGHPQLLAVAAAINGDDFTPFNEAVWIKQPGLGGSVAWHQDGWTHWNSPDLDAGTHGFNFMAQLYGCNASNGLWVVPGSHGSKADIKAMVESAGSDRLPEAVPLLCESGDVAICNRQIVHGSFANTSADVRVTFNFGFHRRRSVLGVTSGGIHNPVAEYDEAYIHERSRLIQYAIDARRQRFPEETPYFYRPLADEAERYRWGPAAKADLKDYNLLDLGI